MHNKIRRRTTYHIHDRPGLSALLRRVIKEQHDGVTLRAAYAIASTRLDRVVEGSSRDLPSDERSQVRRAQSLLSRVLNEKLGGIGEGNYAALRQLVPPRLCADFDEAILSPGVSHLLLKSEMWLVKDRIRASRLSRLRRELLEDLRRRFPAEFKRIDDVVEKWGHSRTRAAIASDRVVDPLLDYGPSFGIERAFSELREGELLGFVKAGVQREVILLERLPDRQRAQEVLRRQDEGSLDPEARSIPDILTKWRAEVTLGDALEWHSLEEYLVQLEYRLEGGSVEDIRGLHEFRSKRT